MGLDRLADLRAVIEAAVLKYRADIDGLRAVAVLAVVAFHAFPGWARGGFVGVDIFFVISGYLISGIILRGLRDDRFRFSTFYARRIRRIFPALALVLATCYACGWFVLFANDYAQLGKHIAGGVGFAANFVLWNEAGYFDDAADTKPLQHLWSLGVEEQFYLVWPLLLVLMWRFRKHPFGVIVGVLVGSFLFNVWTVRLEPTAAFFSPVTRFWELLLGAALAAIEPVTLRARWREGSAVAGTALILAAVAVIDRRRVFPGLWALMPTVGALLIIAAGPGAWVNRVLLGQPVMTWVGLISYPLYLWHWPLLSFARIVGAETPPAWMRMSAIAMSVGLAWLTYRVVERPIRHGPAGALAVPALCSAMVVLLAAGAVTYWSGGLTDRPINRSDRAHFLQYYDELHKHGLESAYRRECDFMDWSTDRTRETIDPSCTAPGSRATLFLWGDSYAQALSLGLRSLLPDDLRLAQVTTSLCRPSVEDIDPQVTGGRCRLANEYAMARIKALRPEAVILAQMSRHELTDWREMSRRILALGVTRVIVIGPSPQWRPSLPEVVATHYWGGSYDRVSRGLVPEIFDVDRQLAAQLQGTPHATYVSLLDGLCNQEGCLAVVPDRGDRDLIAVDSGHLSPKGSVFVANQLLRLAVIK